jgi:hypothetical protein
VDGDTTAKEQRLYQLTVKGRGEGYYGGESVLSLSLTPPTTSGNTALMFNKDLGIGASPSLLGECGGIYAGGDLDNNGKMVISDGVATAGAVIGNGTFEDPDGNPVTASEGVAPQEVPVLDPLDYCGEADYILRGGWHIDAATMDSVSMKGSGFAGWKYSMSGGSTPIYDAQQTPASGTYCVYGNMQSTTNLGKGEPGGMLALSIIATGGIAIGGSPFLVADHSEGWLLLAGGDLDLSGKGEIGYSNANGHLYGGSQCQIGGTPIIIGQVTCRDDPDPPDAKDYAKESKINGNLSITYDCGGTAPSTAALIPLAERAWAQRF